MGVWPARSGVGMGGTSGMKGELRIIVHEGSRAKYISISNLM